VGVTAREQRWYTLGASVYIEMREAARGRGAASVILYIE
jgi:hypothetical protein